ncbi:winged helix-turn-helix domain-containing protein [Rhodopirellula sp. JC639]|uniref:winged helix-turn-helix domain-containing protein n=1 Tax=Stieleria mannarensis TaxID=2755585 RepID=UPI001600222A|nr:winged helix-turn-helix domain-containing protein [Rhodopirellula sp. JC639]
MAKKKAAATPDAKPTKVQANGAAKKSNGAAKKPAPPKRSFDNSEIGLVAGEVWQTLESGGEQTLTKVKKSVEAPGDLVTAAVGWLARENKLRFVQSGRTTKVTLQ